MGLYCPPAREFTSKFAKDVLSGEKLLLEQSKVKRVVSIPQIKVTNFLSPVYLFKGV